MNRHPCDLRVKLRSKHKPPGRTPTFAAMTICIAAISENNKIVTVSDRMITLGDIAQYETSSSKTILLPGLQACILVAGTMSLQGEIIEAIRSTIIISETDYKVLPVYEIAKLYHQKAIEFYTDREVNNLLIKFGLNTTLFIARQKEMADAFIQRIVDEINDIPPPPVSAIIAGCDEKGTHIYLVRNGKLSYENSNNFVAIGSGAQNAELKLMDWGQVKGRELSESLFNCYTAKRKSEITPGVGNTTQILYLHEKGVTSITPPEMGILDGLYEKMMSEQEIVSGNIKREWHEQFSKTQTT